MYTTLTGCRDVGVTPLLVVADVIGMDEVTLGENQGREAEHLRKRSRRSST